MTFSIRVDFSIILAVFCVLALFGFGFNALVSWMERRGFADGYVSLLVAVGVLITLGGVAVISWQSAVIALLFFIGSGLPMIIGSVVRYMRRRDQMIQQIKQEVLGK